MGEVNGICASAADARPAAVHVIDDDEEVCWGLETLLASADFQVETHASGLEFSKVLATMAEDSIGCVLTDVQMPGMDGLELLHHLKARGFRAPVIVMTAHGDVVMAVRAMKAGATDFIEKPFSEDVLFAAVKNALAVGASSGRNGAEGRRRAAEAAERIAALSPREREVLDLAMKGKPGKVVAYELGISVRTVEVHRMRLLARLGVSSLAEAVRLAVLAELAGPD